MIIICVCVRATTRRDWMIWHKRRDETTDKSIKGNAVARVIDPVSRPQVFSVRFFANDTQLLPFWNWKKLWNDINWFHFRLNVVNIQAGRQLLRLWLLLFFNFPKSEMSVGSFLCFIKFIFIYTISFQFHRQHETNKNFNFKIIFNMHFFFPFLSLSLSWSPFICAGT